MTRVKYIITMFIMFVFGSMCVNAEGSGLASVEGKNEVNVGDVVTYNIVISNLKDFDTGITGLQGLITYDPNYYAFVSTKAMTKPIDVQENSTADGVYRIAGFALDEGFNKESVVYSITLKAIKEGNTSINLSEFYLSDLSANLITCKMNNITNTIVSSVKSTNESSKILNENTILSDTQEKNTNIISASNNQVKSNESTVLTNDDISSLSNENISENEVSNENENKTQNSDSSFDLKQMFINIINIISNIFNI